MVMVYHACDRASGDGRHAGREENQTYLGVRNILVDGAVTTLCPLGIVDVPEEAEPLVEEGGVGRRHGQLRRRQVVGELGVDALLGIRVHGIITSAVDGVARFGAVAGDVDLLVAGEKGTSAVVHAVAEKVLVDVGI